MTEILEKRIVNLTRLAYDLTIENETLRANNQQIYSRLIESQAGLQRHNSLEMNKKSLLPTPNSTNLNTLAFTFQTCYAEINKSIQSSIKTQCNMEFQLIDSSLLNKQLQLDLKCLSDIMNHKSIEIESSSARIIQLNQIIYSLNFRLNKLKKDVLKTTLTLMKSTFTFKNSTKTCCNFTLATPYHHITKSPVVIDVLAFISITTLYYYLYKNSASNMLLSSLAIKSFRLPRIKPGFVKYEKMLYEYKQISDISLKHLFDSSYDTLLFKKTAISNLISIQINKHHMSTFTLLSFFPRTLSYNFESIFLKMSYISRFTKHKYSNELLVDKVLTGTRNRLENTKLLLLKSSNDFKYSKEELLAMKCDAKYLFSVFPRISFEHSTATYKLASVTRPVNADLFKVLLFTKFFNKYHKTIQRNTLKFAATTALLFASFNNNNQSNYSKVLYIPRTFPVLCNLFSDKLFTITPNNALRIRETYYPTVIQNPLATYNTLYMNCIAYLKSNQNKLKLDNCVNNKKQNKICIWLHKLNKYQSFLISWNMMTKPSSFAIRTVILTDGVPASLNIQSIEKFFVIPRTRPFQVIAISKSDISNISLLILYRCACRSHFLNLKYMSGCKKILDLNIKIDSAVNYHLNQQKKQENEHESELNKSRITFNSQLSDSKSKILELESNQSRLQLRLGQLQFQLHKFKSLLKEKDDQMYRLFSSNVVVKRS
eukprot:NODE_128_length_18581_cov_0.247538.p4 type:complete len:713 gc:universal NODE_128_length_18581_cov_0.247538:5343-3205(-)